MPGPPPKPTGLKLLEGNPGRRKLNPNEPKYKISGIAPTWLSEEALQIWEIFSEQLCDTGVLTTIDVNAFARYCDTFAAWLKLQAFIKKNGTAYPIYKKELHPEDTELADGKIKSITKWKKIVVGMAAYPQAKQYKELSELLLRMEQQFGMTPSSRTKIQGNGPDEGGEDDEF